MCGAVLPPSQFCLSWGDPALGSMGSVVGLMATSKRAHTKGTSQDCCFQCPPPPAPCSHSRPMLTHASTGDPPILACMSGKSLVGGHYSFPLGPDVHRFLFVPSHSGVSVSPSPVEVLQFNLTGLQSQTLWGFWVPLPDPQAGKPDLGLKTFTTSLVARTSSVPLFSCLWVAHPAGMGFYFIMIVPLLPSHCSFSFIAEHGVSFLVGPLGFPGGASGKEPTCQYRRHKRCRRHETQVPSLGGEDPLEEGMATHSSIPAWRIPWSEEPDRL